MADRMPSAMLELDGPPRRRIYISFSGIVGVPDASNEGWEVVVEEQSEAGEWQPLRDTWEQHFADVHRYVTAYLPWRDPEKGSPLSLDDLLHE